MNKEEPDLIGDMKYIDECDMEKLGAQCMSEKAERRSLSYAVATDGEMARG